MRFHLTEFDLDPMPKFSIELNFKTSSCERYYIVKILFQGHLTSSAYVSIHAFGWTDVPGGWVPLSNHELAKQSLQLDLPLNPFPHTTANLISFTGIGTFASSRRQIHR